MALKNNGSLAQAVREKRGSKSIRAAAKEISATHSVIEFVEKGRIPKPPIWLKLLRWLDVIDDETVKRLNTYTK